MRAKMMLLKMVFWYLLSKLLKKPAWGMDWLYQYTLGKSLIIMMRIERMNAAAE